jgi:hypothetical protein
MLDILIGQDVLPCSHRSIDPALMQHTNKLGKELRICSPRREIRAQRIEGRMAVGSTILAVAVSRRRTGRAEGKNQRPAEWRGRRSESTCEAPSYLLGSDPDRTGLKTFVRALLSPEPG